MDSSVPLTLHDPKDPWIDLFGKEMQNPFLDSFGLKIQSWIFFKETHPKNEGYDKVEGVL